MIRKAIVFISVLSAVSVILTTPASAYIDPATTAILYQVIAGIIITAGITLGIFRRKIVLFFKNLSIKFTKWKIERQVEKNKAAKTTEPKEDPNNSDN